MCSTAAFVSFDCDKLDDEHFLASRYKLFFVEFVVDQFGAFKGSFRRKWRVEMECP